MRRVTSMLLLAGALVTLPFAAALADHKDGKDQGSPPDSPPGQSDRLDKGDNDHPSGKDRSEEPGDSFPQGNSPSDPDDDGHGPDRSNGGPDKPGGSGGFDSDKDGNNGCGNDDDFEDDNEGLCLGRLKQTEEAFFALPVATQTVTAPTIASSLSRRVASRSSGGAPSSSRVPVQPLTTPTLPAAPFSPSSSSPSVGSTEVLALAGGIINDADAVTGGGGGTSQGILPLTGGPIAMLALGGVTLIGVGRRMMRARRMARF